MQIHLWPLTPSKHLSFAFCRSFRFAALSFAVVLHLTWISEVLSFFQETFAQCGELCSKVLLLFYATLIKIPPLSRSWIWNITEKSYSFVGFYASWRQHSRLTKKERNSGCLAFIFLEIWLEKVQEELYWNLDIIGPQFGGETSKGQNIETLSW